MGLIERAEVHQATLWEFAGYDRNGEPTVEAPRQICCRWKVAKNAASDAEVTPIAKPVTAFVNEEIAIGSILYKGCLETVVGTGTGLEISNVTLHVVESYDETFDLKGAVATRSVTLKKYGNTLPTVV